MAYPGILTRAEFATGLITRSIKINGYYLLVDQCNINQTQDIDTDNNFIQGGPGSSISNIQSKKITGSLNFPVRVNDQFQLEPAIKELLNHVQNPVSALSMDTNHLLVYNDITAENGGTDNNQLLKINSMVVSSLSISCAQNQEVNMTVNFDGMIDSETNSEYAVPGNFDALGRALSWGDCNAYREESSMRTITSFTLTATNQLETPVFLIPYQTEESGIASTRNDQIQFIGIRSVKWTGTMTELLRSGVELNTFIHGGWMQGENLTFKIGPVTANYITPLFKISQLPLTSSVLTRTTEWSTLMRPNRPSSPNGLFTIA
jgi:hypothetical protein